MAIQKFRKKPIIVEGVQWTGDNLREIVDFIPSLQYHNSNWEWYERVVKEDGLIVPTLGGYHFATVGDWILKGVKNEFYPIKPDILEATYELIK